MVILEIGAAIYYRLQGVSGYHITKTPANEGSGHCAVCLFMHSEHYGTRYSGYVKQLNNINKRHSFTALVCEMLKINFRS